MSLLRASIVAVALLVSRLGAEVVNIGKYPAKIVPEQVATLAFQGRGVVTDLVRGPKQLRVEKDTVVGIMDKDKTEEAREDMELQLSRERLTKQDEIRKLQGQREKLQFYLKLSGPERAYARDMRPEEGQEISPNALKDIDARIDLLHRELNTLERRKRTEFQAKHEQKTLRMPFTGRLQYNFTLPEDPNEPLEYMQNANGRPFATVCDDSAFYITLNISSSDLTLLPEERFSAYIELPGGKRLSGVFSHRRVEKGGNGDMLVYFFKLPVEDHEQAFNMLGSNAMAMLMYSAEEDVVRVPKIKLLSHPSAAECEDWKQLVSITHPGYVVVIVTERDVLIRKQHTSDANS